MRRLRFVLSVASLGAMADCLTASQGRVRVAAGGVNVDDDSTLLVNIVNR